MRRAAPLLGALLAHITEAADPATPIGATGLALTLGGARLGLTAEVFAADEPLGAFTARATAAVVTTILHGAIRFTGRWYALVLRRADLPDLAGAAGLTTAVITAGLAVTVGHTGTLDAAASVAAVLALATLTAEATAAVRAADLPLAVGFADVDALPARRAPLTCRAGTAGASAAVGAADLILAIEARRQGGHRPPPAVQRKPG